MRRWVCCACPVLLMLAVASVAATRRSTRAPQGAQGQAGLDLVPVNVRVRDRAGKPLTDLKQGDFTLLENGVPQQIRHFSLETLAPAPSQPGAAPVVRQGISLTLQRHRVFVFALGLGRLEEPFNAITALLQFVRTRLLPQDQVAVFAYDRALPFTTDHQKVAETLERFKRSHEDIAFEIGQQLGPTGMAPLYGSRALSKKLQAKIDEMMFGKGAKPAEPVADEALDAKAFGRLSLDSFMAGCARTLQDHGNLRALIEYLRYFEGEKHLLFVTEKWMLWPTEENDRTLAAAANDGRVSIHTLQVGGLLSPEAGKEIEATHQQTMSFKSLRLIASLTGGLSSITEPSQPALERIDEMTRSSHLLGYQPSNAAWDGSDRTITVRVSRPEVTVLHRQGYKRDPEVPGFDRRGFVSADRLLAAANFRREVSDIKVKASVSLRAGSLAVEGKIDLARVKLELVDGAHVGMLNIGVFCLNEQLEPVGTHPDKIVLKMTEDEYKRALKDGLPYLIEFPLIRSTKQIRFIVYDYGSDLIGRDDATL